MIPFFSLFVIVTDIDGDLSDINYPYILEIKLM